MDVLVDVQINETTTFDFVGMTGSFQILLAIVPGSDTERLKAIDSECLFISTNFQPTDICAAAIVLRMDVLRFELAERRLLTFFKGITLTIRIVLAWPTNRSFNVVL